MVIHLSACAGLAITIVVVSPNDKALRVTRGETLVGEAGAEAKHSLQKKKQQQIERISKSYGLKISRLIAFAVLDVQTWLNVW